MNTQKFTLGLLVLLLSIGLAQAQDEIEEQGQVPEAETKSAPGEKVVPFQLTFISPLGTNGIYAGRVANNVSINILGGISGGVVGAELGGFVNFSKGNVIGLQAAGLVNGSLGYLEGAQLAGMVNFNKGYAVGLQASGLVNVNTATVVGAQLSGTVNYAMDHMYGVQASGLVNVAIGDVYGLQMSGITNVATKPVNGSQMAGLVNTVVGDMTGLQLAGVVNVATKTLDGAQIGLVNYARNVNGFQLGLINVADSVESGASLGLFNYIRHGYHRFEVESNETFYANTTFKSGVDALYVIYTVGFKNQNGINYWAPGIGIGSLAHLSPSLDMNVDLVTRQVNEGVWWTEELNLLNTLDLNLAYKFSERFSVYGGPSFNVTVSGITDDEGNIIGDSFSPDWNFSDITYDHNRVRMYVGFNAGIRF